MRLGLRAHRFRRPAGVIGNFDLDKFDAIYGNDAVARALLQIIRRRAAGRGRCHNDIDDAALRDDDIVDQP